MTPVCGFKDINGNFWDTEADCITSCVRIQRRVFLENKGNEFRQKIREQFPTLNHNHNELWTRSSEIHLFLQAIIKLNVHNRDWWNKIVSEYIAIDEYTNV